MQIQFFPLIFQLWQQIKIKVQQKESTLLLINFLLPTLVSWISLSLSFYVSVWKGGGNKEKRREYVFVWMHIRIVDRLQGKSSLGPGRWGREQMRRMEGPTAEVCIYRMTQQLLSPVFSLFLWPWEFGSGKVSLATKCITVVFPKGSLRAPSVTLPCRKRPW